MKRMYVAISCLASWTSDDLDLPDDCTEEEMEKAIEEQLQMLHYLVNKHTAFATNDVDISFMED